ncbi:hypothetical protein D9M71_405740 [compost metagenome]
MAFAGQGFPGVVDGGDHLEVAGVVGGHLACRVRPGIARGEHTCVGLHGAGELDVFVLFGAFVEGLDLPLRREHADAVRLAIGAFAPGLGIETALDFRRRSTTIADPRHRELRHDFDFGDFAVHRQARAFQRADGDCTRARLGIGGGLELDLDLLRALRDDFNHFHAFAEVRLAGKTAADQGHFGFAAGLHVARLHRQQTLGTLFGGDEVQAAFVVLGLEHPALHGIALRGEHLAHGHAIDGHVAAPFVAGVEDCTAVAVERRAVGVLAFDADLEGVAAIGTHGHYTRQLTLARQVAAEAPVAHQGIGFRRGALPFFPGRVVQRITLGQQRHHFFAGQIEPVAVAGQGLVFQ